MDLTLTRFAYLPQATLGWLDAGPLRLATLEEGWTADPDGPGGQRREGSLVESCVPDGAYELLPWNGARFQGVYALRSEKRGVYLFPDQVPTNQRWGRSAILIHPGNSTRDIMGCIAVGMSHGWNGNQPWVFDSKVALGKLRNVLGTTQHTLTIQPTAGTKEIY